MSVELVTPGAGSVQSRKRADAKEVHGSVEQQSAERSYTHETTRRADTSPHRLALSHPRALTHAPPRTDVARMSDEAEHQAERGSFMMMALDVTP